MFCRTTTTPKKVYKKVYRNIKMKKYNKINIYLY